MNNSVTLEDYIDKIVKEKNRKKYEVLRETWNNIRERRIRIEDPNPPLTFASFTYRLEYSLWFWTAIGLLVLTNITIYITDYVPILIPIRYVLGTIYVLFLPGFSLVEALYPGDTDLTPLERVALSIGLSLAVIPLIGLILNYTPWGIRLTPIVISTSIFTLTMLSIALYRKYIITSINIGLQRPRYTRRRNSH